MSPHWEVNCAQRSVELPDSPLSDHFSIKSNQFRKKKNSKISVTDTDTFSKVFCDYHGHSRKKNFFLYGCSAKETLQKSGCGLPVTGLPEDTGYQVCGPFLGEELRFSFKLY